MRQPAPTQACNGLCSPLEMARPQTPAAAWCAKSGPLPGAAGAHTPGLPGLVSRQPPPSSPPCPLDGSASRGAIPMPGGVTARPPGSHPARVLEKDDASAEPAPSLLGKPGHDSCGHRVRRSCVRASRPWRHISASGTANRPRQRRDLWLRGIQRTAWSRRTPAAIAQRPGFLDRASQVDAGQLMSL